MRSRGSPSSPGPVRLIYSLPSTRYWSRECGVIRRARLDASISCVPSGGCAPLIIPYLAGRVAEVAASGRRKRGSRVRRPPTRAETRETSSAGNGTVRSLEGVGDRRVGGKNRRDKHTPRGPRKAIVFKSIRETSSFVVFGDWAACARFYCPRAARFGRPPGDDMCTLERDREKERTILMA